MNRGLPNIFNVNNILHAGLCYAAPATPGHHPPDGVTKQIKYNNLENPAWIR